MYVHIMCIYNIPERDIDISYLFKGVWRDLGSDGGKLDRRGRSRGGDPIWLC